MVTMERDLLMKLPLPSLAPTPTLKLTPGTGTMGMLTGLTDMVITVAYGGYGGYYYGKRSADEAAPAESGPNANAEADPWYGYYGYAHRPYGYGYYGHRYGHYGGYYYGKRSADEAAPAESGPNANAE